MTKLLTTVAMFVLLGVANASAVEMKECSAMWKAHKASADYKDPGKGNRMAAWIKFRTETCKIKFKDDTQTAESKKDYAKCLADLISEKGAQFAIDNAGSTKCDKS